MNTKLLKINTCFLCIIALLLVLLNIQFFTLTRSNNSFMSNDDKSSDTNRGTNVVGDMTIIETKYCNLEFPAKYFDYLKIVEDEKNSSLSQTFYCTYNGLNEELFTLHFGVDNKGVKYGYLTVTGEKIPFNVSFPNVAVNENWTDEEYNIICAMQEAINNIISSVENSRNYSKE